MLGVTCVYCKDESTRFGLNSFKALGGAYAVGRLLMRELSRRTGAENLNINDIGRAEFESIINNIIVTCATDGNHGRSVAWGAKRFGCKCVIYIHKTVSEGRERAIADYGAKVIRVDGNYDQAVSKADTDAKQFGYFVVSDTSYDGYIDVPKDVMQGYTVMAQEAIEQIGNNPAPTHIFIQGGVGGLAAAVCAHFWETMGTGRPSLIVVEPDRAACLYESARAGRPVTIHGRLDTIMAGLACGKVSLLAWKVLSKGANAFATISDDAAIYTMKLLANGCFGNKGIVAGESAVAGIAACIIGANSTELRGQLGLSNDSRILVFSTEGDSDPLLYEQIIGKSADNVRNGAQK